MKFKGIESIDTLITIASDNPKYTEEELADIQKSLSELVQYLADNDEEKFYRLEKMLQKPGSGIPEEEIEEEKKVPSYESTAFGKIESIDQLLKKAGEPDISNEG